MAEYTCVYCGLTADSVDHIPPVSVRSRLVDLGIADQYPFVEVRACRECNLLLGARPLWTINLRRGHVKKRLEHRYRTYLETPDWSARDLAELGDTLREKVLNGLAVRDIVIQRLKY